MDELEPAASGSIEVPVGEAVSAFESALLAELATIGLPAKGVLVGVDERQAVFASFEAAISSLGPDERDRSLYLSKFLAAVGAGLFDAALNYLWDETVSELRRRVSNYDLGYFFDIAVKAPDRRKLLRSEADLSRVQDHELIGAAHEIELISAVGFQQLDLIRFMRNHASAAHPNHVEIQAFQLLGYLQTCIKEVITLPVSSTVAETKRLLRNVRDGLVDETMATATAEFFGDLSQDQADNIAAGLFGIYVDSRSGEQARDGVRRLLPRLWTLTGEEQREEFGARYGRYVANGDQEQADLARGLLDVVDASAYLPEPIRVAELSSAIDDLLAAHRDHNNFYNEPGPARRLKILAGSEVPGTIRTPYVQAVVESFLTNGNGIAWNAEPHYFAMIARLTPAEAEVALEYVFSEQAQSKLRWDTPRQKHSELLDLLDPKLTRPVARELLEGIRAFSGAPNDLAKDSALKRVRERLKVRSV